MGVGSVMAAAALWAFYQAGGSTSPEDLPRARALAFAVLSISPMYHALNCRSQTRSIFQLGLFTNRAIWGAIAIGVALQAMALYIPALTPIFKTVPLSAADVVLVFALAALPLVIGELIKVFLRARGATKDAG
jgi:Ca2+-transporting ATPase